MEKLKQIYAVYFGDNITTPVRINVQPRHPENNQVNDDVAISIEPYEDNPDSSVDDSPHSIREQTFIESVNYLPKYFNFMYYIGASSYKWGKTNSSPPNTSVFQKSRFWILSSLAILQALKNLKSFSMGHLKRGNLFHYVELGYYLILLLSRIYYVQIVNICITGLVNTVSNIDCSQKLMRNKFKIGHFTNFATGIGFIFMLMAILRGTVGYLSFAYWTPTEIILSNSVQMAVSVFLWKSGNNSAETFRLIEMYGFEITPVSASFGIMEILLDCCNWIFDSVSKDVVLMAALTMYQLLMHFEFKYKRQTPLQQSQLQNEEKRIWEQYLALQKTKKDMKKCLNGLLNLQHIDNFLVALSFLVSLTDERGCNHFTFILFSNVSRMTATYYFAAAGTEKNSQFRCWIRENYEPEDKIDVGTRTVNISMVLDELSTNPIGLGSDLVYIDKAFICQFVTSLASCFVILAEFKENTK